VKDLAWTGKKSSKGRNLINVMSSRGPKKKKEVSKKEGESSLAMTADTKKPDPLALLF